MELNLMASEIGCLTAKDGEDGGEENKPSSVMRTYSRPSFFAICREASRVFL